MTVFDLEEVELAYCPQYGSAKDAINMAGFVASNVLRGDCPQVYAEDLAATTPAPFLLDVRTPAEFSAGAIPGFVEHPRGGSWWAARRPADGSPDLVTCQVGQRGYLATRLLIQAGRDAANLAGGYDLPPCQRGRLVAAKASLRRILGGESPSSRSPRRVWPSGPRDQE